MRRPQQHVRRVHTRLGVRPILINDGVHYKKVSVPPGWKDVKYYDDEKYLATGVDSKGRTQYVYPKGVLAKGQRQKYARIERLQDKADDVMTRVVQDAKGGRVEAQAVYTMYKTGFRPGSERDTKADKQAYGATTLLRKQVKVKPDNKVSFDFIGKKGVHIKKTVKDSLLHNIMKERIKDEHLFDTSDSEVREYFQSKAGKQFKLKDIRTLKAFEVADEVLESTKSKDPKIIKKQVVKAVSEELGNTAAVAASSYIAPKLEELK